MFLEVNPEFVIVVIVAALSLLFDYFPGLAARFDELKTESKRLITVGLAALTGMAVFFAQCYGLVETNLTCTPLAAWDLFYGIVLAVAVMYGFHKATKPDTAPLG